MPPLAPEDIQQLVPAFAGAAAVILVVAVGVVIFVRRQYPAPTASARGADAERLAVKQGLKTSGVVFAGLGLAGLIAAIAFGAAAIFGPASLLVPASVIAGGLILVIASARFSDRPNR